MNRTDTLQQLSRSVAVMAMQCRYMFILLALFIFSTSAIYASLSLVSEEFAKRVATEFSAGIFLKVGITPDKSGLEKAKMIPGVGRIDVIESSSAQGLIEKHVGRTLPLLTKGVATDRFPYTIVVKLKPQYLSGAKETIGLVAKELSGVQEIRYPIEGLRKTLDLLKRLQAAQMQFGILQLFVLLAGCLSIVCLAVKLRPAFRWQYSLTGLLSGVAAALLMVLSIHLAATTTEWELALDWQIYCWMVAAGLTSGLSADVAALLKRRSHAKQRISRQETSQIVEALP